MDVKEWLQTVLQQYRSPEKTFSDVILVLETYLSLKPKLEHYTSNSGNTQLLLCLHGTIPITYLSAAYNIPVSFWIPREYPTRPPIPYVMPTSSMTIKEGRHVDKSGLCYHQYRSNWSSDPTHSLLEFIAILQKIFAREPPVYTRPTQHSRPSHLQEAALISQSSPMLPERPQTTSKQEPHSPWLSEDTIQKLKNGISVSF
ncbi:UEV domain-containing protein [Sporodiniella umbellata]|nr:UEV domain-containing protein [Sporodiniella umbellata]